MFNYDDLEDVTRKMMLEAIEEANESNNIYYSTRFNDLGKQRWLPLLREAANLYNEHWLAFQIEAEVLMKDFEGSRTPSGGYTIKHVPHIASETMADGQFNRFYMLGLCKYARQQGINHLEIYRAKFSSEPREESQALVGGLLSLEEIESQLLVTINSFNSPLLKPNSGLSLRIRK